MSDMTMDGLKPASMPVNADVKKTTAYRVLLAVVIGLGVLIVIGLGALVVGLATRAAAPDTHARDVVQTDLPIGYTLPPGAQIVAMQVAGDRLILQVRSYEGDEADIIDLQTGKLIGQVKSAPRP